METKNTQNEISDLGKKDFFAQIPNIVDDMDISKEAYRLYCHFKRACGETGTNTSSTEWLAIVCDMSVPTVIKAKKELQLYKIPLINIFETKRPEGGVFHSINLIDIWDINQKHFIALKIKNSNAKYGTSFEYKESDIIKFEKDKALQRLSEKRAERVEKSRLKKQQLDNQNNLDSKNDNPVKVISTQKTAIKEEHVKEHGIKDFSSPKQSFDLFTVETRPLLKKYMQLFGITEQMIPTAKNKGNLSKWKNALNKMLEVVNGNSKLAEKIMLNTFNAWKSENPQFRKDCTSPFNLMNSFKEQYAEFVREQNERAKESKVMPNEAEYVNPEVASKSLADFKKMMKRNNA